MVRLSRKLPGEATHRLRRPLTRKEGREPRCDLRIHGAGGAQTPDHEIHHHGHEPVREGAIGPAYGLLEGEDELGLRARADPVWQDVALQPLHVTEADAPRLLDVAGEGLKRRVDHLLTPPRLLLDAGVVPCLASTFTRLDFLAR